jgi:hypothetical protein
VDPLIALAVFPITFIAELPDKTMFASLVMATRGTPPGLARSRRRLCRSRRHRDHHRGGAVRYPPASCARRGRGGHVPVRRCLCMAVGCQAGRGPGSEGSPRECSSCCHLLDLPGRAVTHGGDGWPDHGRHNSQPESTGRLGLGKPRPACLLDRAAGHPAMVGVGRPSFSLGLHHST